MVPRGFALPTIGTTDSKLASFVFILLVFGSFLFKGVGP
jgi:hypothetical protein